MMESIIKGKLALTAEGHATPPVQLAMMKLKIKEKPTSIVEGRAVLVVSKLSYFTSVTL